MALTNSRPVFANAFSGPYCRIKSLGLTQKKGPRNSQSGFRVIKPNWKVWRIGFKTLSRLDKASAKELKLIIERLPPAGKTVNHSVFAYLSRKQGRVNDSGRLSAAGFQKEEFDRANSGWPKDYRPLPTPITRLMKLFVPHKAGGLPTYLRIMQTEKKYCSTRRSE